MSQIYRKYPRFDKSKKIDLFFTDFAFDKQRQIGGFCGFIADSLLNCGAELGKDREISAKKCVKICLICNKQVPGIVENEAPLKNNFRGIQETSMFLSFFVAIIFLFCHFFKLFLVRKDEEIE
jgi:hypothetical protein